MLARFSVFLPYVLSVPDGERFPVYEYDDEGYKVRVYPPRRSDRPLPEDAVDEIKIEGVPAFQADVLQVDFQKEAFDRSKKTKCDPPEAVIRRAVNSFLIRLRYVLRTPWVHPVDFPSIKWRIEYLNDDGTELEKDENLARKRDVLFARYRWTPVNKKVWEDVYSLPVDFDPPAWESLLLDAQDELPAIGPALVLALTALEVFISHVLETLAGIKPINPDLWHWINDRGDWRREPSLTEQYDMLLHVLAGHSLKEDNRLWESFRNVKDARDSFVHKGKARVGNSLVTPEWATKLVASASDIVAKVRSWIPASLHWPEFKHEIHVDARKKLS